MSAPKKSEYNHQHQCVYVGRRLNAKGKTLQMFQLLPSRKEMCFRGVKGVWIGYTYKCSDSAISAKPERVDREREDNPEWDAEDALVDATRAQKRADDVLKKKASPALKAAVQALTPLVKRIDWFQQETLVKYLIGEARKAK